MAPDRLKLKTLNDNTYRNPSKHRIEEYLMLNWIKQKRKLMNAGDMKEDRVKSFRELLAVEEKFWRVNLWS